MKSLLEKVNAKLNAQGGFLKAVSVLVGGTAFAQLIGVLALPILTRLYNPTEFALFAVYSSLLGILVVASNLRFEIAIPIPEDDTEAAHLVLLSLLSNAVISVAIGVLIWLFYAEIITLLKQPNFSELIWLIPIGVFFSGLYTALQYWSTRKKQFSLIAKTRMVQSISGVSIQIAMGVLGFSTIGLIVGQIVRLSAGIRQFVKIFWSEAKHVVKNVKFSQLGQTFRRYDKFPKYSTFEALANSASIQLPVIIIAALAVGAEAGFLMLAMQVMAIPMRFIGGAVSQVYLAHAPEKYYTKELGDYTQQCIWQLVKIGALPLVVISVLAPVLFPYIFGAEWKRAGDMVLWMLPWFFMQLITSPVSMSLHVIGYQKLALALQIVGLFIRTGGVVLVGLYSNQYLFEYYAVSGFVFYNLYLIIIMLSIRYIER